MAGLGISFTGCSALATYRRAFVSRPSITGTIIIPCMVVPVMLRSRHPHQPARRFHHGLSRSAASSPSSFAAGLEQLG
jgi:hypothetical protein